MAGELPEPTDENIMRYVFGDEVSSKHLREAMTSPAAQLYNQIVSRTNAPIWERRVLPLRTTVMFNLAILACLNRPRELYTRVVGLLRGGISVEEIQEVFLHIGFYVGNPAGVEATAALHDAMENLRERGIPFRDRLAD
jgi:4-carboxymuconolactone decarboxylase